MKVRYRKDCEPYGPPPGHFDVKCINLHDKSTSDTDHLELGMSYFLPNGGRADYLKCGPNSSIAYFVIQGEMTITTDEGIYVLHAGDSIMFNEGDGRSSKNTGTDVAIMLVVEGK